METELIPGVRLFFEFNVNDDAERFRNVFLEAWNSMPKGIRRVISSYWAESHGGCVIEFFPFDWNPKKGNIGGQAVGKGFLVQFNRDVFVRCDAKLFQAAVAHEMAHVFFIASNQPQHISMRSQGDKITTELLAFELTRRMGFPQDLFFEWINCSMSTQGPYLRSEKGETDCESGEFWKNWNKIENDWQDEYGSYKSLGQAKDHLYSQHSSFFTTALGK